MAPPQELIKTLLSAHSSICLCLFLFLSVVHAIFVAHFSPLRYPVEIPRVREPKGKRTFSFRTRLAYHTDAKELFQEAYEKYSKHGKTCLIPGRGFRDEIILPATSLPWISSQPDHILSVPEAVMDVDSFYWITGDRKYFLDSWQGLVPKRDLNNVLENMMLALNEEIQLSLKKVLGTNTKQWEEIDIYETMEMVTAHGASRITVGLPLCREGPYLEDNIVIGKLYVMVGAALGIVPGKIRSLIGALVALPCRFYQWRINRALKDYYISSIPFLKTSPNENPKEPRDHFQQMLRFAQKERPKELNLHDIGTRLLIANFGAFHPTAIAATNLILNVLDSNPENNTISILRSEISKVLAESNGVWSRAAVAKMIRCDSVLRETLQINPYRARNMMRKVMVDNLKTEDGILLPKGSDISMLTFSIQTDGELFDEPFKFDPFRYYRIREASAATYSSLEMESENGKGPAPDVRFISTDSQYLPCGHGKHACPGRYLVDIELKMILAYVLLNYEIEFPEEYEGKRPDVMWKGEVLMPPKEATIHVRRRVDAADDG